MQSFLSPPRPATRWVAAALGLPFALGLALLTLTPARVEAAVPNVIDLLLIAFHRAGWESVDFTSMEIMANVAVFVPVGVLAFIFVPRRVWPLALAIGPALSTAIEFGQRTLLPHRAATVGDILANSLGASIGVAIAILCTVLITTRSPHRSPTLESS